MNRKKLRIGIAFGLAVLVGEMYYLLIKGDERGMVFALISTVGAVISIARWYVEYEKRFKPKSAYEGWVPRFIKGELELNTYAFNFWKWLLLAVSCAIFLVLGTYMK